MAETTTELEAAPAAGVPAAAAIGEMGRELISKIASFKGRGDIALAFGIIAILVVLILPMPKWMLDVSLAFSIMFAVLILMTVIFLEKPLEFSAFPTILLIATLIRLSLNLASTRLILANGHEGVGAAGQVIEAFASFVMGGNFVIGIIIFAILVINENKHLAVAGILDDVLDRRQDLFIVHGALSILLGGTAQALGFICHVQSRSKRRAT